MTSSIYILIFAIGSALSYTHAQSIVTVPSPATSGNSGTTAKSPATNDDISPPRKLDGKVGLVRGVVKRLDPIHDQLIIRSFGGGDFRVAFDGETKFLSENTDMNLSSIPVGTIVSVDTLIDNGKLFARSVRTGASSSAELNGQVVRYDSTRSQLTLRDPVSPEDISVRVTANTKVINKGQLVSAAALSDGTLVRVWFSAPEHTASQIEILAERGSDFTFAGRIIALDLRARVLSLSNDSDQSLRELAFSTLDSNSLPLLKEGADITVQAEFDGDKYNIRKVTVLAQNP
jgi:hypothetical protein